MAVIDGSSGGWADCINASANEILIVLYADEKFDTMDNRTSAFVEFLFCAWLSLSLSSAGAGVDGGTSDDCDSSRVTYDQDAEVNDVSFDEIRV